MIPNQMTFDDFSTDGGPVTDDQFCLAGLSLDEVDFSGLEKFSEPPLLPTPAAEATPVSLDVAGDQMAGMLELASRKVSNSGKRSAEPLYFDLETIPDHSREHLFKLDSLPPETPADQLMEESEFLSQDLATINRWFANHSPPAVWLASVLAVEMGDKKPRKGLIDAVSDVTNRTAERIKTMSVNPMYCRICSAAWAVGRDKPVSTYAGDDVLMEKHLLEMLWRLIAKAPQLIGYGISFFDIPVILTRSMILKVQPTKIIDRRKYGSKDIFDLCEQLFNYNTPKGMGLGVVCKSLGIESAVPDVDGSQVYEMFKANRVDEIRAYNEDDVMLTQRLHRERMAGYFCV